MSKSCYQCTNYNLCRLRDKASELAYYQNTTGCILGITFTERLYKEVAYECREWNSVEVKK